MLRVYNNRDRNIPEGAVYVGRPSKFGNPFVIGRDGTRNECIEKFVEYIKSNPCLKEEIIRELKGKNLICWCSPAPCHADFLLEIANEE